MFQSISGLVDKVDALKRRVCQLEEQGSHRSRRGSSGSSPDSLLRSGQRAIRSSGPPRVRVPTPIPVPRFGMVARINGNPTILVGEGSAEDPFQLREITDLTDGGEEAGPSSGRRVNVIIHNDIPLDDPPAYTDA